MSTPSAPEVRPPPLMWNLEPWETPDGAKHYQHHVTEILPLYCCLIGGSAVHRAAAGGSESVLRYLLDRGGDPVMVDSIGSTPLHDAAEEGAVPYSLRRPRVLPLSIICLCSL